MHNFKCNKCNYKTSISTNDLNEMPFNIKEWKCNHCYEGNMIID